MLCLMTRSQDSRESLAELHELSSQLITCSDNYFDGFVSREALGRIPHAEVGPIGGTTQPECALAQIHLAVAPIERILYESLCLVAALIDGFVLRLALEFLAALLLGGVKRAQRRQQPADGAILKADLNLKGKLWGRQQFASSTFFRHVPSLHAYEHPDLTSHPLTR